MGRKTKLGIGAGLVALGAAALTFFVTNTDIAVLNPEGIVGHKERDLIVIATLLCLLVIVPVFILTFFIAWRYREGNTKAKYSPDWAHNTKLETLWWGIPIAIILVLSAITWKTSHELDPFRKLDSSVAPLRVQVIALQWKWLFIYPDQQVASVNYLRIPENTPINFEITSDAPMNSFWIPKLGSQVYAMAGMTTQLHLMADHSGSYSGSSANISGKGFADMAFRVEATPRSDFDDWARNITRTADYLTTDEYDSLAKPATTTGALQYMLDGTDLYGRVVMKYTMPASEMQTAESVHDGMHGN